MTNSPKISNGVKKKNKKKSDKLFIVLLMILLLVLLPTLILAYYIPPKQKSETEPTEITYQGEYLGQYSDSVGLAAKLVAEPSQEGLEGKEITFTLEAQEVSEKTNEQGIASVNLFLNQGAGDYSILTIFGGDDDFSGSSDSDSFEISKEDTSLTYTGATLSDSTAILTAELSELDEEVGDLSGKRITFRVEDRSVTGTTDSQGKVQAEMSLVGFSQGTYTLTTEFEGDALYLPSSDTDEVSSDDGGGGGGDGWCFIATAAYGFPLASEVDTLRKFRDQYLLSNRLGQQFVLEYYKYSPLVADYIAKHESLRKVVRAGLKPLIRVAEILIY